MQLVLSFLRREVDEYNLISDGDRIAVGEAGAKTSPSIKRSNASAASMSPLSG